jgi:hypothetical protein
MTFITLYTTLTDTIYSLITPIAIMIIIAYVYEKLTNNKNVSINHNSDSSSTVPVKHAFTCPCCNNTYSDRTKYGKDFNGEWFCNDTCNNMYKTRQMYAKQFFPQSNNMFLTSNPTLVPVFPFKVIPGRYSSDGIKFVF